MSTREAVAVSAAASERRGGEERESLARAMARVAGRRGYRVTSIAEVIAEAESCEASFERHFGGKEECFAAAQEALGGVARAEIEIAMEAEAEWSERLLAGLARAVELSDEAPGLARALLVCPAEAGAAGIRCMQALIERLAELVAPEAEPAEQLPPRAALMAISGVVGLIGEELTRGDTADLEALAPELGFGLLMPMLGPVEAGERIAGLTAGARG